MKTVELKIGNIDVVLAEVNDDVIAYVKPCNDLDEEVLRSRAILEININAREALSKHGLDTTSAVKVTGANASGYYAVLKWENTTMEEQPVTTTVMNDKPENIFKRGAQWLFNRPTQQYVGFAVGAACTLVVLGVAVVAAKK